MSDRYTIPTERYIPPSLRPLAKFLGLDDLSNMNPVVGFMRGRDAMSRGDYKDAAIETAAPVAGLGFAGLMRQPLRAGISSLFGVDAPSADPEDIARQTARDARRYRESFDIDAYHGQNDVGSSEGITVFPDGRELGIALEPDFSVPSVADENLGD